MEKPSRHLPKNTTISVSTGKRAELFWQTTNCLHFSQNFRADLGAQSSKSRVHNLEFNQVADMLSGNVFIARVPKSNIPNKYYALSFFNERYYFTTFTLETRTDCVDTLFAVIITTYVTYEQRHIQEYTAYREEIKNQFGR